MKKPVIIKVGAAKRDLDAIRYAAYAVSGEAYVFLRRGAGGVSVELTPKAASSSAGLAARFREELKEEKLRAAIFDANRDLREFMILKALSYEEAPPPAPDDSGLTPEQEKELDDLIAQVEREIKRESASKKRKDPLGITRTWEDRYGVKTGRRRK